MPKKLKPNGKLPPEKLMQMTDAEVQKLARETRQKMAIGHPPYEKDEWDGLCNLECQLHLELVNRHFVGTKTKHLKYN